MRRDPLERVQRLHELRVLLALLVVHRHDHLPNRDALQNLVRAADVVLVVVGDDQRVDFVDARFPEALGKRLAALVGAAVDQDAHAVGRGDEHGVRLAHVVKVHAQLTRLGCRRQEQQQDHEKQRKCLFQSPQPSFQKIPLGSARGVFSYTGFVLHSHFANQHCFNRRLLRGLL